MCSTTRVGERVCLGLVGVLVRHQRAELVDPRQRRDGLEHVVSAAIGTDDRVLVDDLEIGHGQSLPR